MVWFLYKKTFKVKSQHQESTTSKNQVFDCASVQKEMCNCVSFHIHGVVILPKKLKKEADINN